MCLILLSWKCLFVFSLVFIFYPFDLFVNGVILPKKITLRYRVVTLILMFEITNFSYMNMYNYVCCRTRASLLRVHGLVLALFNDEQNCLQGIHCSQRGKGWASRSPIQVIFWWLRFLMVMMVQWWGKKEKIKFK